MSLNFPIDNFSQDYNSGLGLIAPGHVAIECSAINILDFTTSLITPSVKISHTVTAVAQLTSNATTVVSNTQGSVITMFGALNAATTATFQLTSSVILTTSCIIASVGQAGATLDAATLPIVSVVGIAAGSCKLSVTNMGGSNSTNPMVVSVFISN